MSTEPPVIRMANDIARNQAHLSEADAALVVAGHLRSFWDPRMRAELARLVSADPDSVPAAVRDAVALLAQGQ